MTIQLLQSFRSSVAGKLAGVALSSCLLLLMGLLGAGAPAAQAKMQQAQAPAKGGAPSLAPAAPAQAPAVKVDPQEEAAYKAFFDTNQQDADKKIQLGEDFIAKYPNSRYLEPVYASLVQAYLAKQNWDKFNADADKALAMNPDDVSVLVVVGWVIPHTYNASDPDAEKKLAKAETYEKHGIEVLSTVPKPANMTDEQFAESKTDHLAEAHSALGLVYFRRQDFDNSAKELKQSTQSASHLDPTDFYVLGVDLQSTNANSEAMDAFNHCAQIPGGLQQECKNRADALKGK